MQQVIVTVEHPDTVLDANAFGAGALVRLESPARAAPSRGRGARSIPRPSSRGPPRTPSGTPRGRPRRTTGRATRTRAGRRSAQYSDPFLAGTAGPLLTVDELRLHVTSTLTDEALQLLLDAALDAIEDVAPTGPVTELITPGSGDLVLLSREATAITSVVEEYWGQSTTLAADDYELRSGGQTLRRLSTGTNPAYAWRGRVDVAYTVEDDSAERKRVQLELVKLDLAFNPALRSQTIGTWSEDYADKPYADQRAGILASLAGGPLAI